MGRVVDVEINKVNALITLGSMYRNAADAVKEYVSNALDEWAMARREGTVEGPCKVTFKLTRNFIAIDYNSPGMDEEGFENALKHVVDSPKSTQDTPQIGNLGIGLWAFNQVGSEAIFYSKRSRTSPTFKVILRRNSAEAEFGAPEPGRSRREPGMTIVIAGLILDPTKRFGPLSPPRLKHSLADRFDAYLRSGQLEITIECGKEKLQVEPMHLDLPEIGAEYREVSLPHDPSKTFRTQFWFDPTGNGRVSIRHTGVVIVDDLRSLAEYNLGDTIYTSGLIKGFIDSDFLKPLPARAQFKEDDDLVTLLYALQELAPKLEQDITIFQEEAENERRQSLVRRATTIAREIFSREEFLSLELIEGLNRVYHRGNGANSPSGRPTPKSSGNGASDKQPSRNYRSIIRHIAFKDDPHRRSRLSDGTIEINTNNPDFLALANVPRSHQIAYLTMILGKEIIAYNDASGMTDEALEKMVAYGTKVIERVWR